MRGRRGCRRKGERDGRRKGKEKGEKRRPEGVFFMYVRKRKKIPSIVRENPRWLRGEKRRRPLQRREDKRKSPRTIPQTKSEKAAKGKKGRTASEGKKCHLLKKGRSACYAAEARRKSLLPSWKEGGSQSKKRVSTKVRGKDRPNMQWKKRGEEKRNTRHSREGGVATSLVFSGKDGCGMGKKKFYVGGL